MHVSYLRGVVLAPVSLTILTIKMLFRGLQVYEKKKQIKIIK